MTSRHGWTQDNNGQPVFYSGGNVAIYRVYNPRLRGLHHWTTDTNEYSILPSNSWHQEGIKFYATQFGNPIQTQYARPIAAPTPVQPQQPAQSYYPNCAAVRSAGRAPLYRGQSGYRDGLDRGGDGIACDQ